LGGERQWRRDAVDEMRRICRRSIFEILVLHEVRIGVLGLDFDRVSDACRIVSAYVDEVLL